MNLNDLKKRLEEELRDIKNREKEFPNLQERIKIYNKGWTYCLEYVIKILDGTENKL